MENWQRDFFNIISEYENDGIHLVNLFGDSNDLYSLFDLNHDPTILFKEINVEENEITFNNVDDNIRVIVVLSKSEDIEIHTDSQKNVYYHFINRGSFEIE